MPVTGDVVEVEYLYVHRQSGALYQPVYLGPRSDILPAECGTDQLKYPAPASPPAETGVHLATATAGSRVGPVVAVAFHNQTERKPQDEPHDP